MSIFAIIALAAIFLCMAVTVYFMIKTEIVVRQIHREFPTEEERRKKL